MFDLAHILISSAFAQDAAATATTAGVPAIAGGPASNLMNFAPFVLIFGVFYLLVIRPQQKQLDAQNKMIKALQRGDRIVTSGGIHGKIVKTDGDDHLVVEIADGINVKMDRTHVKGLAAKPQPVVATEGEK